MIFKSIMACVFAACIFVQYNDPDPAMWMAIYAIGLVLTLVSIKGGLCQHWYLIAGIAMFAAAAYNLLQVEDLNLTEVFSSFSMTSNSVEEFREAGGLLIQGIWLTWLGVAEGKACHE